MNEIHKDNEALFIDALEGSLSNEQRAAFEEALRDDPELKRSFDRYKAICEVERSLAASRHEAPVGLTTRIMVQVEEESFGFLRRLYMRFNMSPRQVMRGVAVCAVIVLCMAVVWDEDGSLTKRQPILSPTVSEVKPASGVIAPEPVKQEPSTDPDESSKVKADAESSHRAEQRGESGQAIGAATSHLESKGGVVVPQAAASKSGESTSKQLGESDSAQRMSSDFTARSNDAFKKSVEGAASNELADQGSYRRPAPPQVMGPQEAPSIAGELRDRALSPLAAAGEWSSTGSHGIALHPTLHVPRDRESYQAYGERPIIATEVEPVSTFSIDVDTGSYTNVRRMLRSGQLPPPDAVRIEEFLNYFSYEYPVQTEKPFTLSYEIAPAPLEEGKLLVKLGIRARDMLEQRKPWNLVFLIDVSGSMMPQNRLPLVKGALKILVEQMRPGDRVGIVTYAGYSGVALEPTDIGQKSRIIDIIDRLGAGGSTAGAAGIQQAYDLARRHYSPGAVNRVILATDGDFNVGISDRASLVRLIEAERQSGITLTTVGVGEGNLQEATMEQLANKGNGNFFYLDSFEEARKVFQKDVAGTVEVVAKDVKLQMEFNPMQVSHYRLIGYENRALANHEFQDDRIDAGEIGTGHTVTALYEVVLRESPIGKQLSGDRRYGQESTPKLLSDPHQGELGFLRIRYKEPEAHTSGLLEFPVERGNIVQRWQDASNDFRFAAAVSYFGHLLRQSQFRGSYGFDQVANLAKGAFGRDEEGQRREFVQLVELAKAAQGLATGFAPGVAPGLATPWPAAPGLR